MFNSSQHLIVKADTWLKKPIPVRPVVERLSLSEIKSFDSWKTKGLELWKSINDLLTFCQFSKETTRSLKYMFGLIEEHLSKRNVDVPFIDTWSDTSTGTNGYSDVMSFGL